MAGAVSSGRAETPLGEAHASPNGSPSTARLHATGLTMRRGAVLALDGASLTVARGEIHALLGQNGSGKSTMLSVVAGLLLPDAGSISIDGDAVELNNPHDALRHGIAMVSQELALAPDLSVAENVLMGRRLTRGRAGLRWDASRDRAGEVLRRVNLRVSPGLRTADLGPDQQQLVEIARALSMNSNLLILDEPTSSLSSAEVEVLFGVLRSLKADGVSTVLVSHRIPELYAICDSITVLRDGRTVLRSQMSGVTPDDLTSAMVGRRVTTTGASHTVTTPTHTQEPVLQARRFGNAGSFADVDLDVCRGEIVGLAGLSGAGCSQVLQALVGLQEAHTGEVRVGGDLHRPKHIQESIERGIAYLPPDRKSMGVQLSMSVSDNLALCSTYRMARLRRPSRGAEAKAAAALVERMAVRTESIHAAVGSLSGGNQQKVAIGRCLAHEPSVLLLDEPTRGVDVAARSEIHELLMDLAREGTGILVTSSETEELLAICDRIVVMYAGRVAGELRGSEMTEENIVRISGGHA